MEFAFLQELFFDLEVYAQKDPVHSKFWLTYYN